MKFSVIVCLLGLSLPLVSSTTDSERLFMLEKRMDVLGPVGMGGGSGTSESDRIAALERRMDALELLCVARAGMERHCLLPDVLNGEASCPKKMPPGSRCSVKCNPGYLPTPGKETTECKDDGFWTREMECEIPLVIISGGLVDQGTGDSSVEVVSLYPSQGCDKKLAPMPLSGGANRTLHNLFYLPRYDRIMACNGLTDKYKASCHTLSLKTNTWMYNSYTNLGSDAEMQICSWSDSCPHPNRDKGRYAAASASINGRPYVLGGMVYDKDGHEPTREIRSFLEEDKDDPYNKQLKLMHMNHNKDHWSGGEFMQKPRAFFCMVEVDAGYMMIGGLSKNKKTSVVEQSVEFNGRGDLGNRYDRKRKFLTDMTIPRSGHGCAALGGNYSVLVTGGTQGFGETALADAEVFSWSSNTWSKIASMNVGRFGHVVVPVGDKVFAIGGDDRNNNYMDTIEEYDMKTNTWKIMGQKLKKARSNFGFIVVPHSIFDGCIIEKPLNE